MKEIIIEVSDDFGKSLKPYKENCTIIGEIVCCKDCKYFGIKDYWGDFNGVQILAASDQPTCTKWGGGDCKTSPEGYCFLAERR